MSIKQLYKPLACVIALSLSIFSSCSKAPEEKTDPRLNEKRYCNDPDAVNYNVNFPGIPDNSICFFPTQLFKGTYLFIDSVRDKDYAFRSVDSFLVTLVAKTNTKLAFVGFIKGTTDTLNLTADKYYKAVIDSAKGAYDVKLSGSLVKNGNAVDTVSGYLQKYSNDSNKILVRFAVVSGKDSVVNFHYGTARKQ